VASHRELGLGRPSKYIDQALQPPSLTHLLGTDQIGRDQMARVIFGSRASLTVGVLSMVFAAAIGTSLGLVGGFCGRYLDSIVTRFMDGLLAFPALLLAIFIVAVPGPSILNAVLAVAIVNTPSFARLTRAQVLSIREKEFVESCRALGASDPRITFGTIPPNCLSPVIVQFTLGVGLGILVEAGPSFLGLRVRPPTQAWGSMLSTGRQLINLGPWLTTFPGLAIFLAVLGLGVRDLRSNGASVRITERSVISACCSNWVRARKSEGNITEAPHSELGRVQIVVRMQMVHLDGANMAGCAC
jgi:peptide/nickel transport system permease protein